MKKILLLAVLFIKILNVSAQDIDGTWVGKLLLPNKTNLNIVFHIHPWEDGYIATMDSPDQGARDIVIDSII